MDPEDNKSVQPKMFVSSPMVKKLMVVTPHYCTLLAADSHSLILQDDTKNKTQYYQIYPQFKSISRPTLLYFYTIINSICGNRNGKLPMKY